MASPPATGQNWHLLQYFNGYRVLLAGLALIVTLFTGGIYPFGAQDPILFAAISTVYLIVGLFCLGITHQRVPDFETQVSVFAFADVTFLTFLTKASGGISSGIGIFMLIAVAMASFMLGRRMTIFIAALATIALFLQQIWGILVGDAVFDEQQTRALSQAGVLGIAFFATGALGNLLANRLKATEALAARRGVDLANLTEINELVIQHLQSGVLVIGKNNQPMLINERGRQFLSIPADLPAERINLQTIIPELENALQQWQKQPGSMVQRPVRTQDSLVLIPRFVSLGDAREGGALVFLDDAALLKQQAQQLKMAALARLTASIAHEIRNPLGAIANASQLLSESIPESHQDKRLVQIIEDHCRRMNRIIENITQLARRDRVTQIHLDLVIWTREFSEQFIQTVNMDSNVMDLHAPDTLVVRVDPDQLYQVVMNLCQNALRHSPAYQGKPLIHLDIGTDENGTPYLDVSDEGSGIPPEMRENIFDPFFTTSSGGTGLGLYIARELCEGNGGQLNYREGDSQGACFRISLTPGETSAVTTE